MRILSNFTPVIRILVWIMFAISLAVTVISALIVFGVRLPLEISPAQASVLLFSSTIVTIVSAFLGTMHYSVGSSHLRLNFAFIDVLGGRIALENILNIVLKDGKMYISYIWKGSDPVIAQIAINPKNFDKMKTALMQKNPRIVFFDEDAPTANQQ